MSSKYPIPTDTEIMEIYKAVKKGVDGFNERLRQEKEKQRQEANKPIIAAAGRPYGPTTHNHISERIFDTSTYCIVLAVKEYFVYLNSKDEPSQ